MYANMTDAQCEELAKRGRYCWEYAKTGGASHNPNFKKWFENCARRMYRLNDAEVSQLWHVAIRMYS